MSLGLTTGGMERLLVDFARHHDTRAVRAHFVALGEVGTPGREIEELGCVVVCRPRPASRFFVWRLLDLARLLRQLKADVVHTHNAAPQFWGTLAARMAGVRAVVHTRHGYDMGNLPKPVVGALLRMANRVVCVSDSLRVDLLQQYRLAEGRVIRIWNGVDTERYAWAGPRLEPIALAVSRLAAVKDHRTMIRATQLILRDLPGFKLRLVGDGPERPALEAFVKSLALGDSVEFLGERNDVAEQLEEAGVFISSSLSEGLSLTLLEAMAAGIPVLATRVGGNAEIVDEGRTGRLVPAGNPQALAEAFVGLWKERDRWRAMGVAARDRVLSRFEVRSMVRQYERLYASI